MAKKQADEKKAPQIDRSRFLDKAVPLTIKVGESTVVAAVKEFSTGSIGFYSGDKVTLMVDGVPLKCQLSLSLVVAGSKE